MSIEEKVAILQQLQKDFELLQRRLVELELIANEYRKAISTLEFLKSSDKEINALMSLGGGIYAYSEIKESKKVLVDIGSGVVVEKEIESAISFVKKRLEEVEKSSAETTNTLRGIAVEASRIQQEIAELSKKKEE
ncbi:MAG: prefoldin subunit alpha [Archaeoglobaceae archaeon]|nr:prefoldin subunit alpha [Archaeoglobaceae archaeon]MDW8127992.1 prefoldin subunit alpha [Archaeoglobaceae archaeon]